MAGRVSTRGARVKKTNILIVDDYKENIDALRGLIEADDVNIFSAMNGDEALAILAQHDFGLALFDVQLPVMTGFELARLVRGVKRHRNLPIIFVTALQENQSVLFEGYETGAVDLLFKPLDPHVVRTKVRVFVELSRQRIRLQEQVRELDDLKSAADAANLAKTQFLANMSHEIRTPLAAVMGFADLLSAEGYSEPEKCEFAEAVKRNGDLLLKLIDDILDLSKIESNRIEFDHIAFDLEDLLSDVDSTLSFRADQRGVRLSLTRPSGPLESYQSDPMRIKQVLLNVIGNAIKFSNKGHVDVCVTVENVGMSDLIKVIITDDGIGMSEEQVEKIFHPFVQADSSTSRHFGGSGLGLVISRKIARALCGDVRLLSSHPGEGSTFEVTFELQRADRALKVVGEPHDGFNIASVSIAGKRILAVDDSPDNLTLLQLLMRPTGANLSMVESGREALDKLKNEPFDLILMDIQMPEMDGHETMKKIRALGLDTPIIALTAHAAREEHERCRASGCGEVLTKPINRIDLVRKISQVLV